MAHHYIWNCKKCGFHFETSGPHECAIKEENDKVSIKTLPHPGTNIANGIIVKGYCLNCEKKVEIIIAFFKKPGDPWEQPLGNLKEKYRKNYSSFIYDNPKMNTVYTECFNFAALKCPTCKKDVLFMLKKDESISCPECEYGELFVDSEYMS